MNRNIPCDASESIDFYERTIYSVLRSKSETRISGFEEAHAAMDSMMHHNARAAEPDFNALIYSILRLPPCMIHVQKIVLGQHQKMFKEQGYHDIMSWEEVSAKARRRFCQYNGVDTLALYISSKSDIDDIIPCLTAFQIEWNKINALLHPVPESVLQNLSPENEKDFVLLSEQMLAPIEDIYRLWTIWGNLMPYWLLEMKNRTSEIRVRMLDSSLVQYSRSTNIWVKNILDTFPEIEGRPVYFVSSNIHSATNLLSGYALSKREELIDFLKKPENQMLHDEWEMIDQKKLSANEENLLYYILKKFQSSHDGKYSISEQHSVERILGITRIQSTRNFDIESQVIELSKLNPNRMDPRIRVSDLELLQKSNSIILNIDYPLGLAAFNILSKLSEQLASIKGIYVMGKAASLNGVYGDVIIPTVVHDMHSQNTYMFKNAFSAADVEPWLVYGSILSNQRAVSVLGTFLQNRTFMNALYHGGYSDIEMEAGPFLSAMFEMFRPQRHPNDEVVDLYQAKVDMGFLHYVSDTPMSKGKNLGAGTLSYFGMDSTYAITVAILRHIFDEEIKFQKELRNPKS